MTDILKAFDALSLCECCEEIKGVHLMEWGEMLCDECCTQAVAETDAAAPGDTSLLNCVSSDPTPPHPEPDRQPPSDGGLLACPLCGGSAVCFPEGKSPYYWVRCESCKLETGANRPRERAFVAWNTRANPPTEQVALLRERLLSEGAISLSRGRGSTPSYFNCEDDDEGAVIPISVKLRDDLVAALATHTPEPIREALEKIVGVCQRSDFHGDLLLGRVLEIGQAALATPTPEGDFVLVPRVATPEMIRAAPGHSNIRRTWDAMIAAAPNPPYR